MKQEKNKEEKGKQEWHVAWSWHQTQRVSDYFRNSVCIGGSMFVYTLSVNLFCYQGTDFGVSGYACSRYACHLMCGWFALAGIAGNVVLYFCALMCSHLAAFGTLYELKLNFADYITAIPLGYHLTIGSGRMRKLWTRI